MQTFRILPVLVLGLVIMFGMRAVELWSGYTTIIGAQASDATAKSSEKHADAKPSDGVTGAVSPEAAHAPASEPGHDAADASSVPAPVETAAVPPNNAESHDAPALLPSSDEPKDKNIPALAEPHPPEQVVSVEAKPAEPAVREAVAKRPRIPGEEDFMSASEIEVLGSLTKRREDLDKRSAELDMREKLLIATEQRLAQKLAEIKQIETQVSSVVQTLDDNQKKQIASLVKVYENMKPKDAALIMQDLDKKIMLEVAARMKEAKMAPILAAMDPAKAREVTVLLAKRNEIPGREG